MAFKDIFGKPREGVHAWRVCDIAIVDLGATAGVAWLMNRYFHIGTMRLLMILLILSVFSHWLFCVDTAIMVGLRRLLS